MTYRIMPDKSIWELKVGDRIGADDDRRITRIEWRPMTQEEADEQGTEWSPDALVCIVSVE